MSRKLIAVTPLLLIFGIIAQVILLVCAVLLFVPCMIWPQMLDPVYRWITRGMARIMAKAMVGKGRRQVAVVVTDK